MIRSLLFFILIVFVCAWTQDVKASHIVGGEMTYRWLGGQSYEIRLTLRRDCENGSPEAKFDDPANIWIYNGEGTLMRRLPGNGVFQIPFNADDTLNEILQTECEVIGGDVCVHTTTYVKKIELKWQKGGYILAYRRCCRNKTLNNILEPDLTGSTYTLVITEDALYNDATGQKGNSSPRFNAWPPIYICNDRLIDFDHSAIDAEGDSIVYSLCTPYEGADTANAAPSAPTYLKPQPLIFKSPYSLFDLIGGTPHLDIDRKTGIITGMPSLVGQYLVGICMNEYRKGKLLSQVRRDFQYNVRICTTNPEARFEPDATVKCDGDLTVSFTNKSVNAIGYTWIYDYPSLKYTSKDSNTTFKFPKPGHYRVALVSFRQKGCIDTGYKDIYLYDSTLIGARFKEEYKSCDKRIEVSFTDQSFDSLRFLKSWNWVAVLNGIEYKANRQNPTFIFPDTGKVRVTLVVTSDGGCKDSISKEFILNRLDPEFPPGAIPLCIGESTKLILNPDPRFDYKWSPAGDLSCDHCPGPVSTPGSSKRYYVTITDGNCTEEDSVDVKVSPLLSMHITGDTVICSDSAFYKAVGGVESTIEWSTSRDFNPIVQKGGFDYSTIINKEQTIYVRAKSSENCPGSDSITVKNEKVDIKGTFDKYKVCEQDTFEITLKNGRIDHNLNYQWIPDQYILSGQGTEKIVVSIPNCNDQKFIIRADNQFRCSAYDSIDVDVICKPKADFKTEKNCDNLIVSFVNLSDKGNYTWDFGDGSTSTSNDPVHTYPGNGTYTVKLFVDSECDNYFEKQIDVRNIVVTLKDTVVSCQGQSVHINENPDLRFKYEWRPATGLDDPNSPNPLARVDTLTTYIVRVIDEQAKDCYIERPVTVYVAPKIEFEINRDTILCYSDSLLLQAKTKGGLVANIEWMDDVGLLLGQGYQLPQKILNSGFITARATDRFGCSVYDTFYVNPIHKKTHLEGTNDLCPGAINGFIEMKVEDQYRYLFNWSPSAAIVNGQTTGNRIALAAKDTTLYFVDYENEFGCKYRDSFQVNISRIVPRLQAWADKDTIYLGQSTRLHVTPGLYNYEWKIPYGLDCVFCTDPVAKPESSTLYYVYFENKDGCPDTAIVNVIVLRPSCDDKDVFLPNAFSPNGDRVNDILQIRSNFLDQVELYIYDRWGEKVFETHDKNFWWDGTYKGADLKPDVYAYRFKVLCLDGQMFSKKGNITIVR